MSSATLGEPVPDRADEYRYKRFTTALLFRDLRFRHDAAKPGDMLPNFEIVSTDGDRMVNNDVFDGRPVIFIFGSMTCPMTASAAPSVQKLYEEFGERVAFVMLYVREAHPGENFAQSESMDDKLEFARMLKEFYGIDWTVAADNINGDLHRALDPKPNSAYLMASDGTILFRSLWASDYGALRRALEAAASGRTLQKTQSAAMILPVARAMGQVQATMKRGGPQAVRDLWIGGFPMALAGGIATLFVPLSPDKRGIAAVIALVLAALSTLAVVTSWVF